MFFSDSKSCLKHDSFNFGHQLVSAFADKSFDLVFASAVIKHVLRHYHWLGIVIDRFLYIIILTMTQI